MVAMVPSMWPGPSGRLQGHAGGLGGQCTTKPATGPWEALQQAMVAALGQRPSAGSGGLRLLQQAVGRAPAQPQGRGDLADRLALSP